MGRWESIQEHCDDQQTLEKTTSEVNRRAELPKKSCLLYSLGPPPSQLRPRVPNS